EVSVVVVVAPSTVPVPRGGGDDVAGGDLGERLGTRDDRYKHEQSHGQGPLQQLQSRHHRRLLDSSLSGLSAGLSAVRAIRIRLIKSFLRVMPDPWREPGRTFRRARTMSEWLATPTRCFS